LAFRESSTLQKIKYARQADQLAAQALVSESLKNFDLDNVQHHGFSVSRYPSGELTGGYFTTGRRGKNLLPPSRPSATTEVSRPGRKKIRRAVENSHCELKYFFTLTFAPATLKPWHFDINGAVRQDYAKAQFIRFRDTVSHSVIRREKAKLKTNPVYEIVPFKYLWVAELQQNGNIHFHIMSNKYLPVQWLKEVWGQAANSVNVKTLNNISHAVNYIRKYISSDRVSEITGNRYGISQKLREEMVPEKFVKDTKEEIEEIHELLDSMKETIEGNGGTVLAFGFSSPRPCRDVDYLDKNGKRKRRKGVRKKYNDGLLDLMFGEGTASVPF